MPQAPRLGVMEIFFGSPWPREARISYAPFLKEAGFGSYLYGPKADAHLRRRWKEKWGPDFLGEMKALSRAFRAEGIGFGVCFSPMGFHEESGERGRELLREKLGQLEEIGIDTLGLFFDDMPVHDGLAETQLEIYREVEAASGAHVLFCPSFYSYDPILDKVFGARPPGYLEKLAAALPSKVEIAWTGPKVISPEISAEHLREVSALLRRSPSLCDNFFANDGPKNCKFLKLKFLAGRDPAAFGECSSWYFNPMNQAHLSKVLLLASARVMREGAEPSAAFVAAARRLSSPGLASFLEAHRLRFLNEGIDQIPDADKGSMRAVIAPFAREEIAQELLAYLNGDFTVGSECLTD